MNDQGSGKVWDRRFGPPSDENEEAPNPGDRSGRPGQQPRQPDPRSDGREPRRIARNSDPAANQNAEYEVPSRARAPATVQANPGYGYGVAPYSPLSDNAEGGELNLRKYIWLLLKHRWLILGSMVLAIGVGLGWTLLTTPVYRASATLQIERDVAKIVEGQDFGANNVGTAEFYQTQYELLKSRALAERVVANLSLQDDTAFTGAVSPGPLTKLRETVFGKPSPQASANSDIAGRQAQAAGTLVGGLSVEPIRNSSIVKVSFDSPNPQVAAKVANAIAENYISLNLERRYGASTYARTFLEEQLAQLKIKLEESEKQLVAYAQQEQLVEATKGQSLSQTNLESTNASYSKAVTDRTQAELLWQQVQSTDNVSLPQFLENAAIVGLRAKQKELQADYSDKLGQFKPAYPDMLKLKSQIDEIERQIQSEVAVIKSSIKAKYDSAAASERSLVAEVDRLKTQVNDFRNRNIQYTILQREVDTNQQLYEGLLQRYKEVGVAGGVGVNNISVVDKAQVPGGPFSPSLTRNLAIALMLGALLGAGGAFAREQFDDTFKSPEDIEETLGVPVLGLIPKTASLDAATAELDDPRSALAEAYRSLRTTLQFSTTSGVPKTLLVTSSRPGEGKSTTAATLARAFAALGTKVLLIDADLRKPSLHIQFKADSSTGLSNCLTSTKIPPQAFRQSDTKGLTLLLSGPLPPNPAELIASAAMLTLLTVAAESFDLIIIDSPPVVGLADAPLLASFADGTLLVIEPGQTRRSAAKAAMKRLVFARAQIVGAVVNKVDLAGGGYGYGYGYGYGQAYGERYYGELPAPEAKPRRGMLSRLVRRKAS